MKKIFIAFLMMILTVCIFGQTQNSELDSSKSNNIVYREDFSIKGISSVKMNLSFENVIADVFYGDEITIEIDCNNTKKTPSVKVNNGILEVKSTKQKYSKGDICTVFIYIPKKFTASSFYVNTSEGNVSISNLIATSDIRLKTGSGNIKIKESNTSYLNVKSDKGKIKLETMAADYFDLESVSGEIDAAFEDAPYGKSKVKSDSGKIAVKVPFISDFNLEVYSKTGVFWDFFKGTNEKTKSTLKREYNLGGSTICMETNSGDIFLKKGF